MPKLAFIIGTRPDTIKLSPLVRLLSRDNSFETTLIASGQHRELLDQVLNVFSLSPDYDFNIMVEGQDLYHISSKALRYFKKTYNIISPDMVCVQGDTTTTFIAALSAFYQGIPVAHVEAGLRSFDIKNPYPEEMNRTLTDRLSTLLFAPTEKSKENLKREGLTENVFITGNTAIDALFFALEKLNKESKKKEIKKRKKILVTCHRRESFGEPIREICRALLEIARRFDNVEIVYPVHPNPNVRGPVNELLRNIDRIKIIEPPPYLEFISLMKSSYIVLTDSGGLQEEAPSLGKPVLVMRNVTERSEVISAGAAILVGTEKERIVDSVSKVLKDRKLYDFMASRKNPYGDGKASYRIHAYIRRYFNIPTKDTPEFTRKN